MYNVPDRVSAGELLIVLIIYIAVYSGVQVEISCYLLSNIIILQFSTFYLFVAYSALSLSWWLYGCTEPIWDVSPVLR